MRVILDTNVLLSAFIRVDSNPYKAVQAWFDGRFELVSSAAQIEELARVSRYPRIRELIGSAEIGWLMNRIRDRALMIERLPKVDVSSDPSDNFLLPRDGASIQGGIPRDGRQGWIVRAQSASRIAHHLSYRFLGSA